MSGGWERRRSAEERDKDIKAALQNERVTRERVMSLERRVLHLEQSQAERIAQAARLQVPGWRGLWRRLVWVARG